MEHLKKYIYSQITSGALSKEESKKILAEMMQMQDQRKEAMDVAIVGMACRLPLSESVNEYWKQLSEGRSCLAPFPQARWADTKELLAKDAKREDCVGGYLREIDKFDAGFFKISPREAQVMDPCQRLFLEVAWEAVEDAGLTQQLTGTRTGVFVGQDTSALRYVNVIDTSDPLLATGANTSIAASRIAYLLNLTGPSLVLDSACSSSLVALHTAYRSLVDQQCESAIVGGISVTLTPEQNEMLNSPEGKVRFFDRRADGTVWGEGICAIVIKPLDKALKDRDQIYAVIKGSAINNDGSSNGLTAPNPVAQTEVIEKAWKASRINPETISYIEAHGTGTKLGDPVELKGLNVAFRRFTDKRNFCGIGSVKTNIGHTKGVSGLASVVKVALALKHQMLPPTLHFQEASPMVKLIQSPMYIVDRLTPWEPAHFPRRCGVSSFGFSGTNCHMVFEEAPSLEKRVIPESESGSSVFVLSAYSEKGLMQYIKKYLLFLEKNESSLGDICFTANTGRQHYNHRMALLAKDLDELKSLLILINGIGLEAASRTNQQIHYGHFNLVFNKKALSVNDLTEDMKKSLSGTVDHWLEMMESQETQESMLTELCRLYISGADVRWEVLYLKQGYRKTSLPTYPFESKRHWLQLRRYGEKESAGTDKSQDSFYRINWMEAPVEASGNLTPEESVLLIHDGNPTAASLLQSIPGVLDITLGKQFQRLEAERYMVDLSEDSFKRLISSVKGSGPYKIILSVFMETTVASLNDIHCFEDKSIQSLLNLIKSLVHNNVSSNIDLVLLTKSSHEVTGTEPYIIPEYALLVGLGRVIHQELPHISCRCVDYDELTSLQQLTSEIMHHSESYLTAYREGRRYVEIIEAEKSNPVQARGHWIHEFGVYLITGGFGGIGFCLAQAIAALRPVHLILLGRQQFPAQSEDAEWLDKHNAILEMKRNGSTVDYFSADVSDEEQVAAVLQEARSRYGRISGVFHAAGISGTNMIYHKSYADISGVLQAKVDGTWILDKLTAKDELDFMVLFSSIASFAGGLGMADYAAANAYMDAYAMKRSKTGRKTVSVNLATWKHVGMSVRHGVNKDTLFHALEKEGGISLILQSLNHTGARIIAARVNYNDALFLHADDPAKLGIRLSEDIVSAIERVRMNQDGVPSAPVPIESVTLMGRNEIHYSETEITVSSLWGKVLDIYEIDVDMNFYELGGDSRLAIDLLKELELRFPGVINISDIFTYPTVSLLSEYIEQQLEAASNKRPEPNKAEQRGLTAALDNEGLRALIGSVKAGAVSVENGLQILKQHRKEN